MTGLQIFEFIVWYLLGILGSFWVAKQEGGMTMRGLALSITLGGMCGMLVLFLALGIWFDKSEACKNFWDKKVF